MRLVQPEHVHEYTSTSSTEAGREPLKIRYIESDDKDFRSLGINIAIMAILFIMISLIFRIKTNHFLFTWTIPAIAVWLVIVYNRHRLWIEVDEQEAQVFVDMVFSSRLVVYMQGGHFTSMLSRKQPEAVSFKKSEVGDGKLITFEFPTNDGLVIKANARIFIKRRRSEKALAHSLRWPIVELQNKVQAMVGRRLSDYGAVNTFDNIRECKPELSSAIAKMFGGENVISPFELDTGLNIDDPIIVDLSLTPESQEVFLSRAKIDVLKKGIDTITTPDGCTGKDILDAIQAAAGVAEHTIRTYRGVDGATTIALGDAGVAVAASGGGGKGGKGK